MRVLIDAAGDRTGTEALRRDDLTALYAAPAGRWVRANMVAAVDGAATGADGRSGSVNDDADGAVFATLRSLSDVVLVGAGTARAEGYRPGGTPLVVVSGRAWVPPTLADAGEGRVLLATTADAPGLATARSVLGTDAVLVAGEHQVDLAALLDDLAARGLRQVLCEGGPHLLADLVAAGHVDEICVTTTPMLVGGEHPRITAGRPAGADLRLHLLLEHDGTLLARWLTGRALSD